MNSATRTALAPVAVRIKPLLNRLVFHGLDACRGMLEDTKIRVRTIDRVPASMPAIATVGIDRVAPDLIAAGFQRVVRTATREDWHCDATMTLRLEPADRGDAMDNEAAIVREYAVLLTRAIPLAPDLSVRVPSVIAQLALLWTGHLESRRPFSESARVEDLVEIVMRCAAIGQETMAAPEELRRIVARAMEEFLADESSRWTLLRALPDARHAPGVITQALGRFRSIAEAGAV